MSLTLRLKRRLTGSPGAPAGLKSAEPSYNMADGGLYIGFGDDGSGNATGIKKFASDDFIQNLPVAVAGKVLGVVDGKWAAIDAPSGGGTYTNGAGLSLNGTEFSVNYTVVAERTWVSGNFAPLSHQHAASDVTSGVFNVARIPDLDASKITSGVFDVARIPVLPSQIQITSSGAIAALTAPQQAQIGQGTVVTTTDGRRWVYSGAGSKTAEASYIELADITPEWTAVANKPAFATVATSGSYNDLSNRPTLGTMAAQNAASVAITGGTIDGVTLDGGTF